VLSLDVVVFHAKDLAAHAVIRALDGILVVVVDQQYAVCVALDATLTVEFHRDGDVGLPKNKNKTAGICSKSNKFLLFFSELCSPIGL